MMFLLKFFALLMCSFAVIAEPDAPPPPQPKSEPEIQVYTKQSSEAVDALNKSTEVLRDPAKALPLPDTGKAPDNVSDKATEKKALSSPEPANTGSVGITDKRELPRDPTQMSGNFRQALKNMSSTPATAGNATANAANKNQDIPVVELAGKVLGKHKSVLLRFKGRTAQVFEGGQLSLVEDGRVSLVGNDSVVSFRVDKIDKNQVKISVLPYNAQIILR